MPTCFTASYISFRIFIYLYMFLQNIYSVGMKKDKEIRIRADEDFIEKVDYLGYIHDFKNKSDTIRKLIEKEYRKEKRYSKVWDETWVKLMKEEKP